MQSGQYLKNRKQTYYHIYAMATGDLFSKDFSRLNCALLLFFGQLVTIIISVPYIAFKGQTSILQSIDSIKLILGIEI